MGLQVDWVLLTDVLFFFFVVDGLDIGFVGIFSYYYVVSV